MHYFLGVYSQYEDYPPYFKDHEPSIPKVKEGNYTGNAPKKERSKSNLCVVN